METPSRLAVLSASSRMRRSFRIASKPLPGDIQQPLE